MGTYLGWIDFYMELANKLLPYRNDRQALIEKIRKIYASISLPIPTLDAGGSIIDIDPFTVFGLFNKGITNAKRLSILRGFSDEFAVDSPLPHSFDGIPVLNNLSATFYKFTEERQPDDIDNLWNMFAIALEYADSHSSNSRSAFVNAFDTVSQQKGVKWNLTMALYWIRPYEYINLDSRNRWFIRSPENMPSEYIESIGSLDTVPTGEEYLFIVSKTLKVINSGKCNCDNFPELSYRAWLVSESANKDKRAASLGGMRSNSGEAIGDSGVSPIHYWLYSPGDNASKWDEFYATGIMAIGWGDIGSLDEFETKDAMKQKMKECFDPNLSYKNAAHATWQFANDINIGDIIFVKKGMHRIIGRGVVVSDYEYDSSRTDEYKNARKVNWTHRGDWAHPGQAAMKTLTDITPYTSYVEDLNAIFEDENRDEIDEIDTAHPAYTEADFLDEVFMSKADYDVLANLLIRKKNVILQGAPGVGKTFAAKRLAYSMMGEKDPERVMMVQFHQSYSYEDFVMGFRPANTGFELRNGAFYTFCKKAEADSDNEYFFIIDEINRGNLSKIFGELFMLIENDKRGVQLQLLYSDEKFSVPENVYIIGMMNTADRSLAMLDYALRRRFAFFELSPAFDSAGFRRYRAGKNNKKFDSLIMTVEKLNNAIENDDALGRGFRIGHSYFCTQQEIDDAWLNSVITYELVPLLSEYWFDDLSKVRDWERALREAIQ